MSESALQVLIALLIGAGALALVVWPLLSRRGRRGGGSLPSDEQIEGRIAEYVRALDAGTVCQHCLYGNPTEAVYCTRCGRPLPAASAGRAKEDAA